jgi:uncharacterized membrane protein
MPKVAKAVTVRKPVHEVYAFIEEPKHLPEIWPSLYEVKAVEFKANVRRFQWLYNLAGKRVTGKTETIERVPDKKIVEKAQGEIESTFTWKFVPQNGHTKLAFEADYKMPTGFEPKFEKFLIKRNELEAKVMLDSLKARLEI